MSAWPFVDWMAALPWLPLPRRLAAYDVFTQTLRRSLAILRRLTPHLPNLCGSLRLPWTRRWLGRLTDEAQASGMLPLSSGPGCPPIHTRGPRCARSPRPGVGQSASASSRGLYIHSPHCFGSG